MSRAELGPKKESIRKIALTHWELKYFNVQSYVKMEWAAQQNDEVPIPGGMQVEAEGLFGQMGQRNFNYLMRHFIS